ncbi:hypothetical protein RRG08_044249 [Elysia crispata]|uniref:Uncharacterized protein n=1 Tax=Elysia crispata TaxID=231223 RepID=A0AAE0XY83_9GAST|nr:hypothetical protein RRG08_044249 [Elysia crispata]
MTHIQARPSHLSAKLSIMWTYLARKPRAMSREEFFSDTLGTTTKEGRRLNRVSRQTLPSEIADITKLQTSMKDFVTSILCLRPRHLSDKENLKVFHGQTCFYPETLCRHILTSVSFRLTLRRRCLLYFRSSTPKMEEQNCHFR